MSGPKFQDVYDNVRIPIFQPSSFNAGRFRSGANDVNRKYWNCFPIVSGVKEGAAEAWIEKRQPVSCLTGPDFTSILGAVNSNCMYNISFSALSDVNVAAVWDNNNNKIVIIQYRPAASTTVKIGELVGAASTDDIYLTEINIAGTPTLGVVYHNLGSTNSKAYYATSAAGVFTAASLTQITDADFPTQIGTPDHLTGPMLQMNGITYVMAKSGAIYGSDDSSISSWNALNKIQAIQYPDLGVGICRYKHMIVAFGTDSTEFFVDVGNAPPNSRLQRTDQAFLKFGCVSPKSFVYIDNTIYWIGRSSSGTNGLWKLDGYKETKISSQDEDIILSINSSAMNGGGHCNRLWPFICNAQKHLIIGCPGGIGNGLGITASITFTGDPNTLVAGELRGGQLCMTLDQEQFWLFQAGFSTTTDKFFPLMAVNFLSNSQNANTLYFPGAYVTATTKTIGQNVFYMDGTITNAAMNNSDFASYTDVTGSIYATGFQLSSVDFGNHRLKRIIKLALVQRGLYSSGNTAKLWFVWSKNDNTAGNAGGDAVPSMSNARSVDLPNFFYRWYITNLGLARTWTFCVVLKSPDSVAFKELEVDVAQHTR